MRSASGPSSLSTLLSSSMLVGHTSGQCVNPKKTANGVPASSVLDSRLPWCVVSPNGPPIPADNGACAGRPPKLGRSANATPTATRRTATAIHAAIRMSFMGAASSMLHPSVAAPLALALSLAAHSANHEFDLDFTGLLERQGALDL